MQHLKKVRISPLFYLSSREKTVVLPKIPLKTAIFAKKIEKFSKNDLQSSETMIYYVSVARRKRQRSEADINTTLLQNLIFEKLSGFEKIEKKFKKTICKVKKV